MEWFSCIENKDNYDGIENNDTWSFDHLMLDA